MKPSKKTGKASNTQSSSPAISEDRIAERARSIWEKHGRPEGRDLEHWLEAERELRAGRTGAGPRSSDAPTDDEIEADKRLDGLVQRPRET